MRAVRWVLAAVGVSAILLVASSAAAQTVIFSDDFESYTAGSPPGSPWQNMFSGFSCVVTTEQANGGTQSMRSESYWDWARWDYVQVPVSDFILYEAAVQVRDAGKGGAVGFGFVEPGTTSTGWYANAVLFSGDGNIYWTTRTVGSATLGTWTTGTWYEVMVRIDYIGGTADVWIGGTPVGSDLATDPKVITGVYSAPVTLDQFGLFPDNFPSGDNSVLYVDDMVLTDETALPTEQSSWGRIKSLYDL
jgi:hypothetical protein